MIFFKCAKNNSPHQRPSTYSRHKIPTSTKQLIQKHHTNTISTVHLQTQLHTSIGTGDAGMIFAPKIREKYF